jgi:hypothetical protein
LFEPRTARIAQKLFDTVQKQAKPSFFSLVAFSIQQKIFQKSADEETVDVLYWKNHGWLQKSAAYFTGEPLNPVKVYFAKLVSRLVMKFIVK